jgi:hypothetical protein
MTDTPHDEDGDPQTIELDCPPGFPRPGELIGAVIEGTGLEPREPSAKFFGCWTWDYSDVPAAQWRRVQPTLAQRIRTLYRGGWIRFGSW